MSLARSQKGFQLRNQNKSKHVTRQKGGLRVTDKQDVTPVTPRPEDLPSKRYAALRPWLDLANTWVLPKLGSEAATAIRELIQQARDTETFPADSLRHLLGLAAQREEQRQGWAALSKAEGIEFDGPGAIVLMARTVARVLNYCVEQPRHRPDEQRGFGQFGEHMLQEYWAPVTSSFARIFIDAGRIAVAESDDPLRYFWRALRGVPADRLSRCAMCSRFYCKLRSNQPACSRQCATALRVRKCRHRKEEHERDLLGRVRALYPTIKDSEQMARELGITVKEVRPLITRVRREAPAR